MDNQDLRQWEATVDADDANPLASSLPNPSTLGTVYYDTDHNRSWTRVLITGGKVGGRWAYWQDRNTSTVIADSIFNSGAHHFAGMLANPYTRNQSNTLVWVLTHPIVSPPPRPLTLEDKPKVRYEKSREVYDVETGETKEI